MDATADAPRVRTSFTARPNSRCQRPSPCDRRGPGGRHASPAALLRLRGPARGVLAIRGLRRDRWHAGPHRPPDRGPRCERPPADRGHRLSSRRRTPPAPQRTVQRRSGRAADPPLPTALRGRRDSEDRQNRSGRPRPRPPRRGPRHRAARPLGGVAGLRAAGRDGALQPRPHARRARRAKHDPTWDRRPDGIVAPAVGERRPRAQRTDRRPARGMRRSSVPAPCESARDRARRPSPVLGRHRRSEAAGSCTRGAWFGRRACRS